MLVKDLPTEAARSVGMMRDGFALRIGRAVEKSTYKRADHIVVISDAFSTYLQGLGIEASRITEIPDWADVAQIHPGPPDPVVRRRLGAGADDFLVVHTGNMGAKQDLLNVVAAAALLSEDSHIKLVLIGDGTERSKVAEVIAFRQLGNIRLLPLQASHEFSAVLTAADALLINQAPRVIDSVLPSKLLAYMAAGRAVIAAVHPRSTTADLIRQARCGALVDPGQPEVLAALIRSMAFAPGNSELLAEMGQRGRMFVEAHFERSSILRRWDELLARVASRR
jgi:glycosyltransferase involved in cell wall biosynthesis